MNKGLQKAFVKEEENERNIKSALKLQELVKERLKEIQKDYDYNNTEHLTMGLVGIQLQSLVEKSEKTSV